jgi:hypothetical protein
MANKKRDYSGLANDLKGSTVVEVAKLYGVSLTTIYAHIRKQGIAGFDKRGFGGMCPDRHRALARKGGISTNPALRTFSVNRDIARSAARKRNGLDSAAILQLSNDLSPDHPVENLDSLIL